ncbi:ATP synthase subunit I [Marinobacter salinisoli]|uniref:ATP synthase subunit I n=1 Tax=Marinobacter salinisoli TaxID=2769486 RepID=A0ABX7MVM7_9GAMM|nr:ATP synthase subunit I [Marinobacter salinisoli]QSP95552.1 ATP synthase subunit I [Marinobacter salinisoli]
MTGSKKAITYVPLKEWLIIEMVVAVVLSLLWLMESKAAGYSAFIGGLIFIVPNAYFAHRSYRFGGARQMHLAVNNMFRAVSIKIALTAVFFAAVFTLMESVHGPALLFTFAVMVVIGTALRWLIRPRPQR